MSYVILTKVCQYHYQMKELKAYMYYPNNTLLNLNWDRTARKVE